ncbi:hypothetical protein BP6252_09031 [Coleophoma cylindrospora]|uniref:FAD dependent oxidoreductase domain-containing protein n=1 Tax=Coleophoma cylindrospora TaxID=1849047 RepID=A0A3D8R0U0_9HELO|nr:hypothetical protein BP6252_09031 [Coleophoma cylindrospora]
MDAPETFVILGAGVIGLTTALELAARYPHATIHLAAKFLPGDTSIEYTSPWAGANFSPVAKNAREENWDTVTYRRFTRLAEDAPESGVQKMELRALFDMPVGESGVFSPERGRVWYEELVGGFRGVAKEDLPEGAVWGHDWDSFIVNVPVYLSWLRNEAEKVGVQFHRRFFEGLDELYAAFPQARAFFNCTGLGSISLKGGQVMLIESPRIQLTRSYERANKDESISTYVYPRNPTGGVIIGGCRLDHNWEEAADLQAAEAIKRRCCELAPELGQPEDLKVLQHIVGLRRKKL